MKPIVLKDKKIYRASKGKKVKFVNSEITYGEIAIKLNDNREVVEVDE